MTDSLSTTDSATQAPNSSIITKHYDLMIIGTGSGNMIPGPEFGDASIAIVEKGAFGGTCLNVGCIPTKMYVYAADIATAARESAQYGIHAQVTGVDWPAIVRRVFEKRIDPISQGGEQYRRGEECPTIDVYDAQSHFVAPKTLVTKSGNTPATITADRIILAAGSRPFVPPVITESGITYHTNEDILRLPELPASLIIMGGGVIAAEFAHVFSALGVDVTVINRSPRLLRKLDQDISDRFTEVVGQTYRTVLGRSVEAASETDKGITLRLDDGAEITADALLVALGRTPNGDTLHVTDAGIDLDDAGRVVVDKFGQTTADGVWALGDISSPYQLKHVANHEAKVVKHNVLLDMGLLEDSHDHAAGMGAIAPGGEHAGKQAFHHTNVPAGVFTHPQIATVGMTEDEAHEWAKDNDTEITVKIQNYGDVAYGWAMEDTTGFAKLIADKKSGKLLGAHFIGPQATTLIHQLITMMEFGLDCRRVANGQYWIHPALAELTENALLGLNFSDDSDATD